MVNTAASEAVAYVHR